MKSKVDPLVKLLEFRQGEASRELLAATTRLDVLEREERAFVQAIERGEKRFDEAQQSPLPPEDHALHRGWLERTYALLEAKRKEVVAQRGVVENCREALAALHIELKTMERYKENLAEKLEEERKSVELKEMDEIAGQKHRRGQA